MFSFRFQIFYIILIANQVLFILPGIAVSSVCIISCLSSQISLLMTRHTANQFNLEFSQSIIRPKLVNYLACIRTQTLFMTL